ncbi:MAG: hypothetical protein ACFFFG_01930 [Candidatus Thorarchaeota archaeon]
MIDLEQVLTSSWKRNASDFPIRSPQRVQNPREKLMFFVQGREEMSGKVVSFSSNFRWHAMKCFRAATGAVGVSVPFLVCPLRYTSF